MNNKNKKMLAGFIVVILAIWVVVTVINAGKKDKAILENMPEDLFGKVKEELVVTNHNDFRVLETSMQKFIETIVQENYKDSYEMLGENLKKKYNMSQYTKAIQTYASNNLYEGLKGEFYINANNLVNAYHINKEQNSNIQYYVCKYLKGDGNIGQMGIALNVYKKEFYIVEIEGM